jgi:predicted membrane protein
MGSIEIDLTTAEIKTGETLLDLTAIMGGIEVKVPADLAVIYDGSAILGGVTFKDQEDGGIIGGRRVEQNITGEADKIVRIQARAIMGGVEIK